MLYMVILFLELGTLVMGCKILLIAILLGLSPGTFSQSDVMSKATMKKLCEMPEFQEALANDAGKISKPAYMYVKTC